MEYGFKNIATHILWIIPIVAFSQEAAASNEQNNFEVPNNYSELSNEMLASKLHPPITCDQVEFDMSRIRFLTKLNIEDKEFLATVCMQGAYQDFKVTYLITHRDNKTYAHSLAWLEPVFVDNQWKLAPTYKMSSSIHLTESGKYLLNKRRYVSR